jgi:ATP-binding cassette, subfamily F, member 3
MSILTLNNLSQSFGAFDAFVGASASLEHGGKIGLVGPNGIGKTSLLLILAGLALPSQGSVYVASGTRIGYLRQEAMTAFSQQDNTVFEEMLGVFTEVQQIEARLRELEHDMAGGDSSEEILDEYGTLQEQFERLDGYTYEVDIKRTLEGLGFKPPHWELPLRHLSGGQKTRALLARLLLEKPDLLILDEPTNHLDVDAVEWLETRLRLWDGALLIVSHDRYFLDRTVDTIWEMSRTGIETYRGNYSAYLRQRQERWERNEAIYEQEKERLFQELDYIKRNIARASTNAMAVGRLRRLSRDIVAIRSVGFTAFKNAKNWTELSDQLDVSGVRPFTVMEAEREIKALQAPNIRPPRLHLRFKTDTRSGDLVLRARDMVIGYPDAPLFSCDNIRLERGERAALIGPNGMGKTTFLKTVMNQLAPLAGEVTLGASLKIGYFAQAHDGLNTENTVIDELIRHKHMPLSQARKWLAHYLFRSDDVYKKVGDLSGGERGKLAMAILALEGANFLLLDEPTNHLDIQAQEVLQEVLERFEGTVLLVTHDRYLVDALATQIWTLEAGHLHVFEGAYQEFLATKQKPTSDAKASAPIRAEKQASQPSKQVKKKQKPNPAVASLEDQIHQLETTMNDLTAQLQAAHQHEDIWRLSERYAQHQQQLEALMLEWTLLAEPS